MRPRRTVAAFDSRCPDCGGPILEGDELVFDKLEDRYVCEDCGDWLDKSGS